MGTTNFDAVEVSGVPTMGIGGGLPIAPRYFWVNSVTGSDGNTGDFNSPYATIEQALTAVGVQHKIGDTIVLMQGHSETITGAGGIACATANVNIIGLGIGSTRPTFLMDGGTTVTATVTAANVLWRNCVFLSGHASVVTCFNITSTNCVLDGLEFGNNTTNENFLTPIKATGADNTADGLTVINCRWLTSDADDLEMIEITGNLNKLTVANNLMISAGTASPLVLSAGAKVLTQCYIGYNNVQNANTSGDMLINNGGATNTGLVCNNNVGNLDTTGPQDLGAATGLQFFANYTTSTSTLSGGINPVADTPTT